MKNQEYLIVQEAELGSEFLYCGKGNMHKWKDKIREKAKNDEKYLITEISAINGPYDVPLFQISQMVAVPKKYKTSDAPLVNKSFRKRRVCGFELDEKTKGLLKKIVSKL